MVWMCVKFGVVVVIGVVFLFVEVVGVVDVVGVIGCGVIVMVIVSSKVILVRG